MRDQAMQAASLAAAYMGASPNAQAAPDVEHADADTRAAPMRMRGYIKAQTGTGALVFPAVDKQAGAVQGRGCAAPLDDGVQRVLHRRAARH